MDDSFIVPATRWALSIIAAVGFVAIEVATPADQKAWQKPTAPVTSAQNPNPAPTLDKK